MMAGNTYKTTDDSAKVEDHPEIRNISAFGCFSGIAHHDGALGGPKQSSAHAEKGSGKDVEALILGVRVAEESCNVDTVAQAAK